MSETTTRLKLLYGAAGSSVIGIVLVVFFAFGMWIEGTPGSTIFSTRGVQSAFDSTVTVTRSEQTFRPGSYYYYWVSIDTLQYTPPSAPPPPCSPSPAGPHSLALAATPTTRRG